MRSLPLKKQQKNISRAIRYFLKFYKDPDNFIYFCRFINVPKAKSIKDFKFNIKIYKILFHYLHKDLKMYELDSQFLNYNIDLLESSLFDSYYDAECFEGYVQVLCEALMHSNQKYKGDYNQTYKYMPKITHFLKIKNNIFYKIPRYLKKSRQ